MYFLKSYFSTCSTWPACFLLFTAMAITVCPLSLADEKADLAAANALIAIVEGREVGQTKQAKELADSIPAESKVKPVAAIALALIHIRESQFSEARKVLAVPAEDQVAVPDATRFFKERLKLWLLLEAGESEKTEPQFKRVVTMSLGANTANSEQAACCSLIGGIVGMLQCDGTASCSPLATLTKAKELLTTKVEAKNARVKFEEQLYESSKWGLELAEMVNQFEGMGIEKADVQNRTLQAEFDRKKQEQLKLRGNLKSAGGEKRALEDQRKKWIRTGNNVNEEMKKETPGMPAFPVDPGPRPHAPSKPNGSYRIDPKTQAAVYVPPSDRDERNYDDERRSYNDRLQKWQKSAASFEQNRREYPAKLELWKKKDEERRTLLQSQWEAAKLGVASTEKALKGMQVDIKQGVGKDLKQTGDQLDQLERSAAIANIAYKYISSNDPKTKRLLRPSNFRLINDESECIYLRKALRDL